ncbi:MAG: hypothetical protein AAGC92_03405 [Pseudomonadota bacterium]
MSVAKDANRRGVARISFAVIGLVGGLACLIFAAIGISGRLEDHASRKALTPAGLNEAVVTLPKTSDILRAVLIGEEATRPDPSAEAMRDELAAAGLIIRDEIDPRARVPIDPLPMLPAAPEGWVRERIDAPERRHVLLHELRYRQRAALVRSDGDIPPPMPKAPPFTPPFATSPDHVGFVETIEHSVLYTGPKGEMVMVRVEQIAASQVGPFEAAPANAAPPARSVAFAGRSFGYDRAHEWAVFTSISLRFGEADRLFIDADIPAASMGWLAHGLDLARLPAASP